MRLLSAKEVAVILGVTRATVYRLARAKMLPVVRLGRQCRWDEKALHEFVRLGGTADRKVGLNAAESPKG